MSGPLRGHELARLRAENTELRAEVTRVLALLREQAAVCSQWRAEADRLKQQVADWEDHHEKAQQSLLGKLNAARAEADRLREAVAAVEALEARARREWVKRDYQGLAVVKADDLRSALAAGGSR